MTTEQLTDRRLTCVECGGGFLWTANEQRFFAERDLSAPRRCLVCRARRRAEKLGPHTTRAEYRSGGAGDLGERRAVVGRIEVRGTSPVGTVRGYGAVFNEFATIGGVFRERIAPGAFTAAIGRDDVRALFNHDPSLVLGRTAARTLRLAVDGRGLQYEIDLPDTQAARDLLTSIQRGDISQSSFAFEATSDEWTYPATPGALPERVVQAVTLYDVSPVTYPAYQGTTVSASSEAPTRDAGTPATRPSGLSSDLRCALERLAKGCPQCAGRTAGFRLIGRRADGHMRYLPVGCAQCTTAPRRGETARSPELLEEWRRFDRALSAPPRRLLPAPAPPAPVFEGTIRRPKVRVSLYDWHG